MRGDYTSSAFYIARDKELLINLVYARVLMDSAALFQRTVKENTDDLHAFLEDIKSWEDEIKKKDELLSKQKPILKKVRYPFCLSRRLYYGD